LTDQYGKIERQLLRQKKTIAGVDEVGRGALAGPVYAGAAILDFTKLFALDRAELALIRDSKSLSRSQREKSLLLIQDLTISHATASAETYEIEELGITKATFLAMTRALGKLKPFDILLIDGKYPLPGFDKEQRSIIGGDASCFSIAAASILAKEARDSIMREQDLKFPGYGFDSHVGYATNKHLDAIRQQGACALHRRNFEPVKTLIAFDSSHLDPL
jgi:ribonuclease HII